MNLKKTNKEKADELFARKKIMISNIKEKLEDSSKKIKVQPQHDAPDLHSFNNYGDNFYDINKKQENINFVFLSLDKKQKKAFNDAIFIALKHNNDIDLL